MIFLWKLHRQTTKYKQLKMSFFNAHMWPTRVCSDSEQFVMYLTWAINLIIKGNLLVLNNALYAKNLTVQHETSCRQQLFHSFYHPGRYIFWCLPYDGLPSFSFLHDRLCSFADFSVMPSIQWIQTLRNFWRGCSSSESEVSSSSSLSSGDMQIISVLSHLLKKDKILENSQSNRVGVLTHWTDKGS